MILRRIIRRKGHFKSKSDGTGNKVQFDKITNALTKEGKLNVKGKTTCVTVTLPDAAANASSKVEITLTFTDTDAVCKQLKKLPGIKSMCGKSGDNESISNNQCTIQIGGSGGIQF